MTGVQTCALPISGAKVVREKNFLAVVAEKEWDAVKAAKQLKVKWRSPAEKLPTNAKVFEHIEKAPVVKREEELVKGQVDTAFKGAKKIIEAQYNWPFQLHSSMGPACAIADVRADKIELWTGSQKPHFSRDGVANLLGEIGRASCRERV